MASNPGVYSFWAWWIGGAGAGAAVIPARWAMGVLTAPSGGGVLTAPSGGGTLTAVQGPATEEITP